MPRPGGAGRWAPAPPISVDLTGLRPRRRSGARAHAGRVEDLRGLCPVAPAARLGPLRGLQVLVALEEVLDLVAQLGVDVVDVAHALERRVAERHAQHLLVRPLLVRHVEDADRADADPAARERRLGDEHEGVERVAVIGERPLEEAVVGGVGHRGEEAAVEDDAAELLVPLVLVAGPHRDLDEYNCLRAVGHAGAAVRTSAASRSAIRSTGDSIPTDSRMRLRGAANGASAVEACVIRAGCSIRLSTPPSDSASWKILVRAASSTASSSDSARNETMPPKSRIWRAAIAWPGCVGSPG